MDRALEDLFRIQDVQINWQAIKEAGFRELRVNLSRAGQHQLGSVCLMWFTRDGQPVCHNRERAQSFRGAHLRYPEKGDSAVAIGEAAKPGFRHPWMWENTVQKYQEEIKVHGPNNPFRLTLPAYDVGRRFLLLNGAHRSIATLRAGVDYNIELVVIEGPIHHRALRDLVAFER